jgi:hypothetical protein
MDANLLHISYEGNALEDPWAEPDESMFTRSVSPENVSGLLAGQQGWAEAAGWQLLLWLGGCGNRHGCVNELLAAAFLMVLWLPLAAFSGGCVPGISPS